MAKTTLVATAKTTATTLLIKLTTPRWLKYMFSNLVLFYLLTIVQHSFDTKEKVNKTFCLIFV